VSFRGSSHVYYFEGKAPEGEEVGKAAEYFNAVSGSIMQVVSWTGDEVEFYNGVNLTSGMVNSAFGLAQDWTGELVSQLSSRSDSDSGNYLSGFKFALIAAFVLVMFVVIFGRSFSCSRDYEAGPIKPTPAGSPPLAMGAIGTLFDKQYRITAHAVVETDEVGFKCEHHEYALADNNGGTALLVCGDQPGAADWIFFEPLSPMVAPTAKEAAAKQVGEQVELDGFTGKVTEIFLSTIEQTESGEGELKPGIVTYGFRCKNEYFTLLGRWNNAGIQYFRGRVVPAKKAAAAFSAAK